MMALADKGIRSTLKSDHCGIEIAEEVYLSASDFALKSDHCGIEIK